MTLTSSSYLFLAIIILVISDTWAEHSKNGNLQLVHVFFRHGSRTPELSDTYPSDPYNFDTFSPMGWGQLTNEGKQAAFHLGEVLRRRYDPFLGHLYTPEIVEAVSTDFDRTKMTALLVLAGLFPPAVVQTWNESIPWMPVPYHCDRDKHDYTLRRPTKYCPSYQKALDEVMSSPQVYQYVKTHRKLFQYIGKNAKKPINKPLDVFRIYQTLNAEENMNLSLPEWTKSVYPGDIHAVAAKQCELENSNAILKRLNGGRMLAKVIRHMVQKAENDLSPSGRKIYVYSGHENNVINILAALNLFEPVHVPKYTAAVLIEMHLIADENYVKVLYVRDSHSDPETLQMEGCERFCPLDDFVRITEPHVPVNFTAECGSPVNLD